MAEYMPPHTQALPPGQSIHFNREGYSGPSRGLGSLVGSLNAKEMLRKTRNLLGQFTSVQGNVNEVLRRTAYDIQVNQVAELYDIKQRYGRAQRHPSRTKMTIMDDANVKVHFANRLGNSSVQVGVEEWLDRSPAREYIHALLEGVVVEVFGTFARPSKSALAGSSSLPPGPYLKPQKGAKDAPRFYVLQEDLSNGGGADRGTPLIRSDLRAYKDFLDKGARKAVTPSQTWHHIQQAFADKPDLLKAMKATGVPGGRGARLVDTL